MEAIQAKDYQVVFGTDGYTNLNAILKKKNYSILFILVDSNTHEHCLAPFLQNVVTQTTIEIIEVDPGEEFKNLETCEGVWNVLSELNADRKSALINLGGGVVTDLGGFVACCFKRGIDFINIPTTLLSMVDASVGGKTGVDLGPLKNQIGIISNPELVLVDTHFLGTLSIEELRSGYAEMLKHGLISSETYWNTVKEANYSDFESLGDLIRQSIAIKNEVVLEDPFEKNRRKSLNYGHTLGHAIESYFMESDQKQRLLHGEAIAIGMILANYLSTQLCDLEEVVCNELSSAIMSFYQVVQFDDKDIEQIITLLKYDKKNSHGKVLFVLLNNIGEVVLNQEVSNELIYKAFEYYKNLNKN
ncbi:MULTISPECIES: 3-dehydroquinate synthase [Leeuwenhoekiella]|uniref:3-dehydroquinate synthase n=1 Tax=Leeuwenhoekiella TaxID=283735 RepID=UPI000C3B9098|nr:MULTISPECIES: 3-dehydroquinate synthase [Leeuwenhoekiella]MAO45155.1 3-dehydroquinate synthase [Leeuwenhoekiella sp.]|tara:strand:+ start:34110 stop:35189 length:1080 start_codon:yes stop_codon:yes gene_type:complete